MSAPDWRTIPGMMDLAEQRVARGGEPFTQAMFDYLWDYAGQRNVPPQLALAILPQEGTGSFDTSSANKAGDGGNGFEAQWEKDVQKAVNLLEGKLMLYAQACAQGWKDLAVQVVSPGDGDNLQADGMPDQWCNWLSAIVRPDGSVDRGCYAQHASWWIGVRRYYLRYGGTLTELERCALAMDRRAPRVAMTFRLVSDDTDYASNWNATAPESAVICTSATVTAPPPPPETEKPEQETIAVYLPGVKDPLACPVIDGHALFPVRAGFEAMGWQVIYRADGGPGNGPRVEAIPPACTCCDREAGRPPGVTAV